jgi:AmiR/NasT family two-component response regulator
MQTIAQCQAALTAAKDDQQRAQAALAAVEEFLRARLGSVPVIEQAKGIVMAQQRCGPEEAFDLLRRMSQRANVKISVLAAQIVGQIAGPALGNGATPPSPPTAR